MSEQHTINEGDEVMVMFDQGLCPEGKLCGIVKHTPCATGDSFHIISTQSQDKGKLFYVQTFQFMTVLRRGEEK